MIRTVKGNTKPQPIEAILWDGSYAQAGEIILWVQDFAGFIEFKETNETVHKRHPELRIHTSHGKKAAAPGDWIVKEGPKDDFYPCKPDEFDEKYNYITNN